MSLAFRVPECVTLWLDHNAMQNHERPEAVPVQNETPPSESHLRWTNGITEVLNGGFKKIDNVDSSLQLYFSGCLLSDNLCLESPGLPAFSRNAPEPVSASLRPGRGNALRVAGDLEEWFLKY